MEGLNDSVSSLNITNTTRLFLKSSDCQNTSSCASYEELSKTIYILKIVINFVIFPILTISGLIGNISTILIFSGKKIKNSTTTFITGLAISDLLFICFRLIHNIYVIGHVFFAEAIRFTRPNSFVWMYLSYIPQRIGNCLIFVIVLERFTAVWFPVKFKQIWTLKASKIVLFATVFLNVGGLISGMNVIIFSFYDNIPEQGFISTEKEIERYVQIEGRFFQVCSLAYRVLADILPLPLVLVFNTLIIVGIHRNSVKKTQERKEKEAKMTMMLLCVSVSFVVLCSPLSITVICTIIGVIEISDVPLVLYETFSILTVVNSVINFFVYGLCNKAIKREYLELWCCLKTHSNEMASNSNDIELRRI